MKFSKIFCVLFLGHLTLFSLGQTDQIDSIETLLSTAKSNLDKGVLCLELATRYQRIDLSKTKYFADLGLTYMTQSDSLRALLLDQLGRYHFYTSQIDSALYFFRQVESIYVDLDDQDKVASINISIGSALLRSGQFETATQAFINSATHFEKTQEEGSAAKCYVNIATAFAELSDYETAIEYSLKALPILRRQNMTQVEMILLPNLATQYYKSGNEQKALDYYGEAEKIALENNSKRSLALIYNNLGDLYMSREDYLRAETNIKKAIDLKKELNQLKGLEESYFNLGLIRYKNRDFKEALRYYSSIENSVMGSDRVKVLLGIKNVYKNLGVAERALDYSEKATSLSDSLNQEESKNVIAEMSKKYQITQKENEILVLTNDNQTLEMAQLRSRNWIIGLICSFAALMIGLISYLKNLQKNKKIREQQYQIEQQDLIDQLHHSEQEAIVKMIQAQEVERNRISNDLHDSLGSKMATLQRNLQLLKSTDQKEQKIIDSNYQIAGEVYKEIRDISHNINSGILIEKGLITALEQMADRLSIQENIVMRVISVDVLIRLSNLIEIQIFRVIQELVTNVIKHAKAQEIVVQLTKIEDHLNVIVEDDGKGFNLGDVTQGLGLNSISERLKSIGSEINIDSELGRGSTMIFNVPLG